MKPSQKLAETMTPDGQKLTLMEHDGSFCIRQDNEILMHSQTAESERVLGVLGAERLCQASDPRVLIGGLGLGFTLRSVLDSVPADAQVEVAELLPAVIDWNRTFLGPLNGDSLNDRRVTVRSEDVALTLRRAGPAAYDTILLDIDNGPTAMVQKANARIYQRQGIELLTTALKPKGRIVIWSAVRDVPFEQSLSRSQIPFKLVPAKTHPSAKRSSCALYVIDPLGHPSK